VVAPVTRAVDCFVLAPQPRVRSPAMAAVLAFGFATFAAVVPNANRIVTRERNFFGTLNAVVERQEVAELRAYLEAEQLMTFSHPRAPPGRNRVSVSIRNRLGPTPCASATPHSRASPGPPRRPVCVDTMSGSTVRRFSCLKNLPELDDGRRAPRPYPSALTLDEPDQRTPLAIGRAPILPDFRANSGNATRFGRAESACPRSAVLARRGCQPCLSRAVRVHDEDLIERGAGPARTRTERHEITPPRPSS
jgi:hypothetical protein